MLPDDIKQYLPQYLSDTSKDALLKELKNYPNYKNIYSDKKDLEKKILQGDGFSQLPFIELPQITEKQINGIILSNSCDIDPSNCRLHNINVVYAPIISLEKYRTLLIKEHVDTQKKTLADIESHIRVIKSQKLTNVLYLQPSKLLNFDSIVFFDRCMSAPPKDLISENNLNNKLFTLNNFGFYLFLFKLSYHSTRIKENVDRN